MDERQLVCYPRNGTCFLRSSVCCFLLAFSPFKYPLQFSPITDRPSIVVGLLNGTAVAK